MIRVEDIFVGVNQRIDGIGRYKRPAPYLRVNLNGTVSNLEPATARALAKALKHYADLADPPQRRR